MNPSNSDNSSACMQIGHVNKSIPCNRGIWEPSVCQVLSCIDLYFGISVWNVDKASVQYLIMIIPNSNVGVSSLILTDTTMHLSDVWYRALGCQGVIALNIYSNTSYSCCSTWYHFHLCDICCRILPSEIKEVRFGTTVLCVLVYL